MPPLSLVEPVKTGMLNVTERENILAGMYRGLSIRAIAEGIGRSPSTVSRELKTKHAAPPPGGSPGAAPHPAVELLAAAGPAARRREGGAPKVAKRAANDRLRAAGTGWLEQEHSPEQIAARLRVDFADDPEMWVSHETIYQSLYVEGRGALRRDLATRLRTVGRCANHAARTQNGAAGSRHGRHRRPPSRGRRPRRARRLGGW